MSREVEHPIRALIAFARYVRIRVEPRFVVLGERYLFCSTVLGFHHLFLLGIFRIFNLVVGRRSK
jgi:hypothetical protein